MKNLQLLAVIGLSLLVFSSCGKKQNMNDSSIKRLNNGKKLLNSASSCQFYKLTGDALDDPSNNATSITKNAAAMKLKMGTSAVKRPGAPGNETEIVFAVLENSQMIVGSAYFNATTCKLVGYTQGSVSETLAPSPSCDFAAKLDDGLKPSAGFTMLSGVRSSYKYGTDKEARTTLAKLNGKPLTEVVQFLSGPQSDRVTFRYFDQCNLNSQAVRSLTLQNYADALKLDPVANPTPPSPSTPSVPATNKTKPTIAHQPSAFSSDITDESSE